VFITLGFFVTRMSYNFDMNENHENKIVLIKGLNPESADQMGYEWWKDIIFDKEVPKDALEDILNLENKGYVFGECATLDGKINNFIGVYTKKASV